MQRLVRTEAPRRPQTGFVDVGGQDLAGVARPRQLDVQDAGDPAAQHDHVVSRSKTGGALASNHAGQRLDERTLLEAHRLGKREGPALDVDRRQAHELREASRLEAGRV